MSQKTENMIFVLREGSTQEEQWNRDDIVEMCRGGALTPGARLFVPETGDWVRIDETDFAGALHEAAAPKPEDDEGPDPAQEEYREVRERLTTEPGDPDLLVEAGRLAWETGDREAARRHFQDALDAHPFHGRVRQEVSRRFSRAECRTFRHLERPDAVWDDLAELVTFPLERGPVYLAVVAAVVALLGFIPYGGWAAGALLFLWGYQIVRSVARGSRRPPLWHSILADPLREAVLPSAVAVVAVATFAAVIAGVARGLMLLERESGTIGEYIGGSPILMVSIPVALLAIVPAVMVVLAHRDNPFAALHPVVVVRSAIRLETEYVLSVLVLLGVAFASGLIGFVAGGIPVAGGIISAGARTFAVAMAGLVLGRLVARNGHVLDQRAR